MSNQEYIKIEGAYENNLKHISLDIPKKQITYHRSSHCRGQPHLRRIKRMAEQKWATVKEILQYQWVVI